LRSNPDYVLKANVIELGLVSIERKLSLYRYITINQLDKKLPMSESDFEDMYKLYDLLPLEMKEAGKINNASYHRRLRLSDRIESIFNSGDDVLFLTLTFRDSVLKDTSKETRRRYVSRFLKDNCISYVANIDYGAKNHREHYHAVVNIKDLLQAKKWAYGALNFERVVIQEHTNKKLSKYLCKLVNHAIKETTQRNYVIYSRSSRKSS